MPSQRNKNRLVLAVQQHWNNQQHCWLLVSNLISLAYWLMPIGVAVIIIIIITITLAGCNVLLGLLACALARHIVCVIGLEAVALEDDESWPSKKPGKKERKEAVTVLSLGSWHLKNGRSQQHSTPTLDLRQTHGNGSVGDGHWCRLAVPVLRPNKLTGGIESS